MATLLSGAIVSYGFGWQYVFIIPAGMLFLVFVWSYFCSKASPQDVYPGIDFPHSTVERIPTAGEKVEGQASPLKLVKKLFSMRLFQVLLVFSSLTTILRQIFFFWTALLFTDIGLDIKDAIFKSAMFPLAGCLGTLFLGRFRRSVRTTASLPGETGRLKDYLRASQLFWISSATAFASLPPV